MLAFHTDGIISYIVCDEYGLPVEWKLKKNSDENTEYMELFLLSSVFIMFFSFTKCASIFYL